MTRLAFGGEAVKSLRWEGDALVDDVRGGERLSLDGTVSGARVFWAYAFDGAITAPSGRFTVLYTRLGTKAVVAEGARLLRELDRSYYCANAYEYPVCLFALPDGREVVAHCPDEYNRLEIEDLETGERLTVRPDGDARDVFHSRLRASPDGRRLLSAGWRWHPYGVLDVFDVEEALRHPANLDDWSPATYDVIDAEVESACWLTSDLVAVTTSPEEPLGGEDPEALGPSEIGVLSLADSRWVSRAPKPEPLGTLEPFGEQLLSLYAHPKLVDPATGEVVAAWPEIASGTQDSSIVKPEQIAPVAVDAANRRFAVADGTDVLIVEVG